MILGFFWSLLTRFAKTVGCLFFIAGLCAAVSIYREQAPAIEAARYQPSSILSEHLGKLQSTYADAQRVVLKTKGVSEFPAEYGAAAFTPHFPRSFQSAKDFQNLQSELQEVSLARDAMKRFVTDHLEQGLADIEQKLLSHAATLTPPAPSAPLTAVPPDFGLYDTHLNPSEANARKATLENAKQILGVLQSSAEAAENKQTLGNTISEIDTLEKLLPANIEQSVPNRPPSEPLNAEKVAGRIREMRADIKQVLLSSWALDELLDLATQTATEEQQKYLSSELRIKRLNADLYPLMATVIAAGTVFGVFFLLIGDWTEKSSTIVHQRWCDLIKGITATPSEVYDIIEEHVANMKVPELEISREFWHEGGALSAKRQYLRFARERLVFDICAAPFGTSFFLSFRCSEIPLVIDPLAIFVVLSVIGGALSGLALAFGLVWGGIILVFILSLVVFLMRSAVLRGLGNVDRVLMKTPLLAPLYEIFLRPVTYYRIDSTAMYLQAVQGAVAEAFQKIFGDQAPNLLPETVPKPVLDEIYRKRFQ
jgi:peptidoglycan hydrolase-like protein with peptidoglycan-binding domain